MKESELKMYKGFMRDMMSSCFTYGGLEGYNYERYILPYKEKLGEKIFNSIYTHYGNYLKNNFMIEHGGYTDHEGCTYSSLIKHT